VSEIHDLRRVTNVLLEMFVLLFGPADDATAILLGFEDGEDMHVTKSRTFELFVERDFRGDAIAEENFDVCVG